jgi:hypothetical protein
MTPGQLEPLEIATGMVLPAPRPARTERRRVIRALRTVRSVSPREALENVIRPALERSPCLISFSGGRDSSAVLAAAVALARREGLALPIPATIVLPAAAATDEAMWQEQVIRRLDLPDWQRFTFDDELGLLGPYARRALTAHGLLWPANIHFHLPLLDAARGGALLTGIGGDELFVASRRVRPEAVWTRVIRPVPRDVLRIGLALAPHALRRAAIARRVDPQIPWLADAAQAMVRARIIDDAADEPVRLASRMGWWHAMRYLRVGAGSLERMGRGVGVDVINPLLAAEFWAAAATTAAPAGFSSRTDGMRRLFGDLLPDDVIERTSKADFTDAFWTDRERGFASRWSGQGLPDQWVDRDALVAHWLSDNPTVASSLLLQSAWLGSEHDAGEQLLHSVAG